MNFRSVAAAMCLTLVTATASTAATLVSQLTFDAGFTDTAGGATASGAGSVSGGRYNFAANQGLGVTMGTGLSSYSIVFSVELDATGGYRKLLDVGGLVSDNGLYNLSGGLRYFSASSSGGSITANTDATIAVTFDGTTTVGYVDGVQAFSFAAAGAGYLSTLTSFTMVEDDSATGKFEATSGTLDFLEVYDGVLSANEIAAYTGPAVSPVPLPAGGVLLLTGLLGVAGLSRRKKRAA